jgi:hypothetical protein
MLRKKFILLIVLFCFHVTAAEEDIIKWSTETKLAWKDFQGNMEKNTPVAAVSSIGIAYKAVTASSIRYLLEIDAQFVKKKSCVWMEKASDPILVHEQGHFDLGEIYARKMRAKLLGTQNRYNYLQLENCIKEYLNVFSDSLEVRQAVYDRETHHSFLSSEQKQWNLLIKKELESLKKYKSPFITVYLKQD